MKKYATCRDCAGDGVQSVTVFKPQSFDRDFGEPYEEATHCETCDGAGEILIEVEEDEDECEYMNVNT